MAPPTLFRRLGPELPRPAQPASGPRLRQPSLCGAVPQGAQGLWGSQHAHGGHSQRLGLSPICCLSRGHQWPHRRHPGLRLLCVPRLSSLWPRLPSNVKASYEVSRAGAVTGLRLGHIPGWSRDRGSHSSSPPHLFRSICIQCICTPAMEPRLPRALLSDPMAL